MGEEQPRLDLVRQAEQVGVAPGGRFPLQTRQVPRTIPPHARAIAVGGHAGALR